MPVVPFPGKRLRHIPCSRGDEASSWYEPPRAQVPRGSGRELVRLRVHNCRLYSPPEGPDCRSGPAPIVAAGASEAYKSPFFLVLGPGA